jgi:hypothetical protein
MLENGCFADAMGRRGNLTELKGEKAGCTQSAVGWTFLSNLLIAVALRLPGGLCCPFLL